MDSERQYEMCEQWIADEQRVHERAGYGENKHAVSEALREQTRRVRLVKDYGQKVNKAKKGAKDANSKEKLTASYDKLHAVANHRQRCLQDMSKISALEESFNSLSMEFAQRATSLVADACAVPDSSRTPPGDSGAQHGEGMGRAAQGCILAVRNNWNWISKLLKCSDVHLKHVSEYHQFFHQVKEYEEWMPSELQRCLTKLEGVSQSNDVHKLVITIKEVVTIFLHWQSKMSNLFESSGKIVPVHLRTSAVDHYRPVTSLCDYTTSEISVSEGEELTLIDNSEAQLWLVRNIHAIEARLPSVICVIPGPDPDAISAVTRLRVRLLSTWTMSIKTAGGSLIHYFLYVFKAWDDQQSPKLKSMLVEDKLRMRKVIRSIQEIFGRYWGAQDQYKILDVRLNNTNELLSQDGKSKKFDKNFSREYKGHTKNIEEIIMHFMNCMRQWETYKVLIETSRNSDYMLLVDSWQNLKYFNTADVVRQADTSTALFDGDDVDSKFRSDEYTSTTVTEVLTETMSDVIVTQEASKLNTQVGMETTEEEEVGSYSEEQAIETATTKETVIDGQTTEQVVRTETEEILHAEHEERKTFVITGVIDPRNGEEVSMQQAVLLGIINNEEGLYVNRREGLSIPIPEAMNQGLIKVEFTRTRKTEEKRSEVGLMTIKTQKESRPYTVVGVMDAKTDAQLSVDDAISQGILDQQKGTYTNTLLNKEMSLSDALDSGYLVAEFDEDAPEQSSEVVTKIYAIHAVVDQLTHDKVSFAKAVAMGLLDKETGAYYHNINKEHIFVGDAIKRGFIKATIVDDPTSIDIAPENKMVVDKVATIRKKLVNPLQSIAAFKFAVEHPIAHEHSENQTGSTEMVSSQVTSGYSSQSQSPEVSYTTTSVVEQTTTSSVSESIGTSSSFESASISQDQQGAILSLSDDLEEDVSEA